MTVREGPLFQIEVQREMDGGDLFRNDDDNDDNFWQFCHYIN